MVSALPSPGVSGSARFTLHMNHRRTNSPPSALSPTSHINKHLLQPRVTPRDQASHGLESHTTGQQTMHACHRHSPHLPAHHCRPREKGAIGEAACANGWGSRTSVTVWARWEWCRGATGRDERDTRQTANFPGVTDISSRGEGVRWPAGSSLRLRPEGGGGRGWSQTYLGGRAQEGLLRLDGFESEDKWVMEAVTWGSLSLF